MLTELKIELQAKNNGTLPYFNANYVHAMFFKMLQEQNPEYSEKLHEHDAIKPFTLSNLLGASLSDSTYSIKEGEKYALRITFLNAMAFQVFYEALVKYLVHKKVITLGRNNFQITNSYLLSNTDIESFKKDEVVKNKKFRIDFLTATSFRMQGKNYLFPDPIHIFKSYSDKWNTFMPADLNITAEEIEHIQQQCFATQYNLKTEMLNMGNYKIVGFRGNCMYEMDKQMEAKEIKIINNLLRFIPYCGTGYKTTMGMGQTKATIVM